MPRHAETELTTTHQLFLQAMLLRRALPRNKANELWKACGGIFDVEVEKEQWSRFLEECNSRLEPLGFQLKSTMDQGIGGTLEYEGTQSEQVDGSGGKGAGGWLESRHEGVNWIALVNIKSDDLAKVATDFNPNEIAFFRKLVDRMVRAPNDRFCIGHHAAVRACSKIDPPIKKADAQRLLNTFVKKGWLSVSGKAIYSLSVRAELELGSYLKETFDEESILDCNICHDIVFRGWRCGHPNCQLTVHAPCLKRWLTTHGQDTDCPHCGQPWTDGIPIGEDAEVGAEVETESESEAEEESAKKRSGSAKKGSNSKKRGRNGKNKADSEEDEDEDEEMDDTPARKPARTRSRRTAARKPVASQADDDEEESSSEEEEDEDEDADDMERQLTRMQAEEEDDE